MASDIALESGIRANLISLQSTTNLLNRTQERLATGKEVNSIIDNPSNFFAARSLGDRSDQLNSRLDGMGQAIQTIQAANAAIDAVRDLVANMKAIVEDALADSDKDSRRSLGEQYNTVLAQLSEVTGDAYYGGVNLLNDHQKLTVQFGEDSGDSTLKIKGLNLTGTTNGGATSVTGVTTIASVASRASIGSAASVASQASVASAASQGTTASVSSQASIASQASVSSQASIASQGSVGGANSQASQGSVASVASQASIASRSSIASSASAGTVASVAAQSSIASRSSIASEASIASQAAVTVSQSYAFTLTTGASEESTADVVGLRSHSQFSTGTGAHGVDFGSQNYINELNSVIVELENIDSVLATQAARLATNVNVITVRENFTESMVNILNEGADKLTLGDMNEEGANLLALQTRQSLGIQSLQLSSQNSQQILRLLG